MQMQSDINIFVFDILFGKTYKQVLAFRIPISNHHLFDFSLPISKISIVKSGEISALRYYPLKDALQRMIVYHHFDGHEDMPVELEQNHMFGGRDRQSKRTTVAEEKLFSVVIRKDKVTTVLQPGELEKRLIINDT